MVKNFLKLLGKCTCFYIAFQASVFHCLALLSLSFLLRVKRSQIKVKCIQKLNRWYRQVNFWQMQLVLKVAQYSGFFMVFEIFIISCSVVTDVVFYYQDAALFYMRYFE